MSELLHPFGATPRASAGHRGLPAPEFKTWFMGGFESATMVLDTGRRLDVIERTGHDSSAEEDYRLLARLGIETVRDALRWHRIESRPGVYEWSSFLPMLRAARRAGVEVIWDLCHFGLPDHLDPWSPDLAERFAAFATAAARVVAAESDAIPYWCPVNEISYWAFAGGDRGEIFPFGDDRGLAWKRQLAGMAIAGVRALRAVDPRARMVHSDPVIHIVPEHPAQKEDAEFHRQLMFDAWDMIAGRRDQDLGGSPDCLDIVGVNFYSNNQWFHHGRTIRRGPPPYRPFGQILDEVWRRYGRPIVVAETGAERQEGPPWMSYVADEIRGALDAGIPVAGCCIYPIMDYPGWVDDRHCRCGLLSVDPAWDRRQIDPEMSAALADAKARLGIGSRDLKRARIGKAKRSV